jgi:hypothetical protein
VDHSDKLKNERSTAGFRFNAFAWRIACHEEAPSHPFGLIQRFIPNIVKSIEVKILKITYYLLSGYGPIEMCIK